MILGVNIPWGITKQSTSSQSPNSPSVKRHRVFTIGNTKLRYVGERHKIWFSKLGVSTVGLKFWHVIRNAFAKMHSTIALGSKPDQLVYTQEYNVSILWTIPTHFDSLLRLHLIVHVLSINWDCPDNWFWRLSSKWNCPDNSFRRLSTKWNYPDNWFRRLTFNWNCPDNWFLALSIDSIRNQSSAQFQPIQSSKSVVRIIPITSKY